MDFEAVFGAFAWSAIAGCPGRYVLKGHQYRNVAPHELLKTAQVAQLCYAAGASDPVLVLPLNAGGLISYLKPEGNYVHTLGDNSGFRRKLTQLGIQLQGEHMTTPNQPLRPRAAALIFNEQGQILLMLRRKNGNAYATLPGGGIEAGETPAQAAEREVLEEVNLVVNVGEQVLEMDNLQSHEHYFVAAVTGGEMRLGDGPEGIRNSAENFYQPQWVDVSRLDEVNLVPEVLRGLVRERATSK